MKKTAKFKTSDGYKFYSENDAKNHAKTLEDRKVTPLNVPKKVIDLKGDEKEKEPAKEDTKGKDTPDDWRQVVKRVELAESMEELTPFLEDTRPSIVKAVAIRKEELILEAKEQEKQEDKK